MTYWSGREIRVRPFSIEPHDGVILNWNVATEREADMLWALVYPDP